MQLAPGVDVDITRGHVLALVFRSKRAKHRSVAMAEITPWLLQLTTHMQVSCGRVSLCRSLSLFFIIVSVHSSVFFGLSRSRSLFLLFSLVLYRSRIACILDVCALAFSALVAPSLHLFLVDGLGTPTPLHLTPQVELIHCGRFLCRCRECHGNTRHVQGANGKLAMRLSADAITDAEA